nr:MAG TPA: hypothetical protein [Caudoviricetes sp.]
MKIISPPFILFRSVHPNKIILAQLIRTFNIKIRFILIYYILFMFLFCKTKLFY